MTMDCLPPAPTEDELFFATTFGATTVRVPRARLATPEGKTSERRNSKDTHLTSGARSRPTP